MKRVVFITNIPSPYRVDFFVYLQKHYQDYEFHVIFSGAGMENRKWHVELNALKNAEFLQSKTLIFRKRYDDRYVFIPIGVERALREANPDIVVAMEYNPTILRAVRYCGKKKIPFVSWTDGTAHSERSIGRIQRMSRKYIIKRAAAFVASSTASRDNQLAYGADEKRCFLSYLTVDIRKYLMVKESYHSRNLIYVGSLIQRKGLDLLFPALAQTSDDIHLIIVGEGPEKPFLLEQAQKLGILERLEFKGFAEGEALRALYASADAFILPTREDCYGLVLLEAMCASLPVIASKYADGAKDLIEEGANGLIVDPDHTEELAAAINGLMNESDLAAMGKRSYERAKLFSFAHVAGGCMDAIHCCLGEEST